MKRVLLFFTILGSFLTFSQEDAWVYFNDKPNASTFLSNPLAMLTQRALDRRDAQGIALNINDVPIFQAYIDQVSSSAGIVVRAKSKWLNCLHIQGSVANIKALKNFTFVNRVEFANDSFNPNGRFANHKDDSKSLISNKNMEIKINFNYGNSANQIQMLNGHLLHQANYTGAGKIIAVLDSGFLNVNNIAPFQRLFANNSILGGYNYVSQSTNVYSLHDHGTMVLSCMGGYVENKLVGTAPDAQYYLFITEDVSIESPIEESFWVEAAEEADRLGADIITSSLGYFTGFTNPNYSHTYSDMTGNSLFASRGANIAFSKGILVVASAGNSGNSSEPHIGTPAEATNVLAVGAVKFDKTLATFSSIGPSFDGRLKPDVMAQGQAVVLSDVNGNIGTASGTSFSCPIIAGMIACLWQSAPNLTNQQLLDYIKQNSDRFSAPSNQFGKGVPDFQAALNSILSLPDNNLETFMIYPNPIQNNLSIVFSSSYQENEFNVFNDLGQLIFFKSNCISSQTIDFSSLSSGLYFYKFNTQKETFVGKLIKN